MRVTECKDRRRLIDCAMQRIPPDLCIQNVQLVNVITGEVYPASVDILDGMIAAVRYDHQPNLNPAKEVFDAKGAYLIPGYIDTHVHVESTMMIPENLARAVLPFGTTSVMTDPHEIANVMGMDGVKFMVENGRHTPLRHFVLAPSCVPSVPALEGAGASFTAAEIEQLLDLDGVIGIAELMDYVNLINNEARMHDIVTMGHEKSTFLQGHAPALEGKKLQAYLCAGPVSDHEARTGGECLEKLRNGMHINLKASSLTNFLKECLESVNKLSYRENVSICTDDLNARDIQATGHINRVVRMAIEYGAPPIDAIRMATYNAAREYGITDLGAVAPGFTADLQIVPALDGSPATAVFISGKLVAQDGQCLVAATQDGSALSFPNTMNITQLKSQDDLLLRAQQGSADKVRVNVVQSKHKGGPFNGVEVEELPVVDGLVSIAHDPNLAYAAVFNRYGRPDATIAVIRNFGITDGAVASTVSHDSHNLIMVYRDPADAWLLAQDLIACGGGMGVYRAGQRLALLELPVAGLMSLHPVAQLAPEIEVLDNALKAVCNGVSTYHKLLTMALVVLPGVMLSDRGIVHGPSQTFIPVFAG